jgi:hypothetical protein
MPILAIIERMDQQELLNLYTQGDRNFAKIDLSRGVDLSWQDLSGANFTGADFYGAVLSSIQLTASTLSQANLAHANLSQANLSAANLRGADLTGAILDNVNLQGAIYDEQTMFPYGFNVIASGCIHAKDIKPPAPPPSPTTPPPEPSSIPNLNPESFTAPASATHEPGESSEWVSTSIPASSAQISQPVQPVKRSPAWSWILVSAIVVFLGGWLALRGNEASQLAKNSFRNVSFPRPACGDPVPPAKTFPVSFYPVFINYSPDNLASVRTQYCRDAYPARRQETSQQAIQVASFTSINRAKDFAEFMSVKLGSGEVGKPRRVNRIDDL